MLTYRHSKDDPFSIARDNLQDGVLDKEGNIWLASTEGVELFSPATGRRMQYLTSGSPPGGNASMILTLDQTGTLWISTGGGGLYWLSKKSLRFPHYSHGRQANDAWGFESIERTRDGEYLFCSYGWVHQVNVQELTIRKLLGCYAGCKSGRIGIPTCVRRSSMNTGRCGTVSGGPVFTESIWPHSR